MEEFKLTEQDVEILNSNKGLTALDKFKTKYSVGE